MKYWILSLALVLATGAHAENEANKAKKSEKKDKKMIAVIETSMGTMRFNLLPDKAPITVENFVKLAENKGEVKIEDAAAPGKTTTRKGPFYDGLTFHRLVEGFMIQGGDPYGSGSGGPVAKIKGEFDKSLSHKAGALSMARTQDPNSASSQFFVCVDDAKFLDGQYAMFGEAADPESLEVARKISKVPKNGEKPQSPVTIKHVKIERK